MGTHLSILLFSGLWGCQLKAELGGGHNLAGIRPLTSGQMQDGTPPAHRGFRLDWKGTRLALLTSCEDSQGGLPEVPWWSDG